VGVAETRTESEFFEGDVIAILTGGCGSRRPVSHGNRGRGLEPPRRSTLGRLQGRTAAQLGGGRRTALGGRRAEPLGRWAVAFFASATVAFVVQVLKLAVKPTMFLALSEALSVRLFGLILNVRGRKTRVDVLRDDW
jgi:hypothetical protein